MNVGDLAEKLRQKGKGIGTRNIRKNGKAKGIAQATSTKADCPAIRTRSKKGLKIVLAWGLGAKGSEKIEYYHY
jgi:hypothetical protein